MRGPENWSSAHVHAVEDPCEENLTPGASVSWAIISSEEAATLNNQAAALNTHDVAGCRLHARPKSTSGHRLDAFLSSDACLFLSSIGYRHTEDEISNAILLSSVLVRLQLEISSRGLGEAADLVGDLTGSDQWWRPFGRAPSCGWMTGRMTGGGGEIAVLRRQLIRNHFIHHHWRMWAVGWWGACKP
jgi:hypothetical protein